MPHTNNRLRNAVASVLMGLAFTIPNGAHAQVPVNKIYGKTYADVIKMYGRPIETAGSPINYTTFNTAGAASTQVWYHFATGVVTKVRFEVLAKPGDTPAKILKGYGLSIGDNPKHVMVKAPAISMHSQGTVPGSPWSNTTLTYMRVMPFETELVAYCKAHNLKPGDTWFWTIQLLGRPKTGGNMMNGGDTGSGGKGKGKKGGKHGH